MSSPNVGYATLQIIPSAKGFGAALNGQVDPIMTSSGRRGGEAHGKAFTGAFLPSLKSIGAGLGAMYAGSKAIGFMKDSIAEASDLNEAGTKLQQVFGKATGDVLKFAQAGAKGLGQSNLAVQNAAAQFGIYGRAAGLAGKANADFSTQLVQLSTDLASFYNANPADTAAALAAGLRGESEPLRQYGVLLDDATLRNEALRQGLIKTTKQALTPQQRVLAAQAVIMRQTSVAQGDFARTSGGLANQQRILAAQTENLKGRIGAALLPAAVGATKALNGLFSKSGDVHDAFGRMSDSFSKNVLGGQHLGDAFSALFAAMKDGDVTSNGVVGSFERVGDTIHRLLPVIQTYATTFTTKVLPALAAFGSFVASRVLPIVGDLWNLFSTQVLPVLAEVATFIYGTLVPRVLEIAESVAKNLAPVFDALVETIRTNVVPVLQTIAAKFREWLPTIERVLGVVLTITGAVLKFAAVILGAVLPPLIKFAGFLIGTVVKVLVTLIDWTVKVVGWMLDFGSAIGAVGTKAAQAVGWVKDRFGDLVGFVKGLPARIASAASGLFDGIKDAFRAAVNWIVDKWNGLEFRIPSVDTHIPGVGKVGGFTLGTPDIPRLAQGGIVPRTRGGMLALIGEGREDEAVIPLSKLPKPPPAPPVPSPRREATPVEVPLYLEGREIARAVFEIGGRDYAAGRKEF